MSHALAAFLDRYALDPKTRTALAARPEMFIDGAFATGRASATMDNLEPSTGDKLGEVLLGTAADVEAAVAAARLRRRALATHGPRRAGAPPASAG